MPSLSGSIRSPCNASANSGFSTVRNFRACSLAKTLRSHRRASHHDDFGADPDPLIEILYVGIAQPDAAGGDVGADGPVFIGAVDAVECRAEINRAGAQRIALAARHEMRQIWLALQHFRRRHPIRPFLL